MPNITTNHTITYTNALLVGVFCSSIPINNFLMDLVLMYFTVFSLRDINRKYEERD